MYQISNNNLLCGIALSGLVLGSLLVAPLQAQEEFPEGEGKAIVTRSCGVCHGIDQIARQRKTENEWQATVVRMQGRGAAVTGLEADALVKYLFKSFPRVEDTTKVNVNKATAKQLEELGFTAEEAEKIVDYRERKGDFREWGDLLQIYGVPGQKVEAVKDKITF
jgi:competence ComEA-like helix-hairpin-helix protein